MISGRCYCGAIRFEASKPPSTVAYCHCVDCRRSSGAPVAAFAEFMEQDVIFLPDAGRSISLAPQVERSFCAGCGTPTRGRYNYLPGRIYIGIGLFDTPETFPPALHSHAESRLAWLHLDDDLPRHGASARDSFLK